MAARTRPVALVPHVPAETRAVRALLGTLRMRRTLLVVLALVALPSVASADPSDPQLVATSPSPDAPPERARVVVELHDGISYLALHGFPAIRRDGRYVAAYERDGDFSVGHIVFLDVHTGDTVRRIPLPERIEIDDDWNAARIPDPEGARRLDAILARGGYVALRELDAIDLTPVPGPNDVRFEGAGLRVTALETDGEAELGTLTIERDGRTIVATTLESEEVAEVAVAADASFVVLTESWCACECASWPRLIRTQ